MSDVDAPLPSAPCPWCGSSTQVGKVPNTRKQYRFFVYCDKPTCSAIGPLRRNPAMAVIAWNGVVTLEERVDALANTNQGQYKGLCYYLGLVQKAYDFDGETGEWKPKNLQREVDRLLAIIARGEGSVQYE